jgi:hypothetical protein
MGLRDFPCVLARIFMSGPIDLAGRLVGRLSGFSGHAGQSCFRASNFFKSSLPNAGRPFDMFHNYRLSSVPPGHLHASVSGSRMHAATGNAPLLRYL